MWCSTSKLIGENGHLQPEDRSLIAASLKNIYKPLIASGYTAPCPTLGDLYRDLNKSNLRRAKQLALMLDVFAKQNDKPEEEYIDVVPILENLYFDPDTFLAPIKEVRVENG